MSVSRLRTPSYRLHKPSGQAVVTLDGRDIYLGQYGTPRSRAEFDRILAEWLSNGRRLPGSGLHVAMACRFLCCRYRRPNRWGLDAIATGLRTSEQSARRGLHAAELAGLLAVEREPGCKLAVSVLDLPGPESGPGHRPLYGPIPWSWWLPASRLPGRSLHVGAVCWLLAGWERSASFELISDGWADLGLSRFAVSRGLDTLEQAKLVSVARKPGRSPVVTILATKPTRADSE